MFSFSVRIGLLGFLALLKVTTAHSQSADVGMTVVPSDAQGVPLPAGHIYALGERAYFGVTITNHGPNAASGVAIDFHAQPKGALDPSGRPPGGECGQQGVVTDFEFIGNLAVGQQLHCYESATIVSVAGPIVVSGELIADTPDPNLANNTPSFIVQTGATATALITKPTTKNSTHVALSQDGKVAVFESQETDLVASNTNANGQDVYRVVAGQTVLENTDSAGHQLIGTASLPAVSGDGSVVAFVYSTAAKAKLAKEAVSGQMFAGASGQPKHPVDAGMGGVTPNGAVSGAPSVASANGSHSLVFCSAASNLVPGDANGARDVFLIDPLNPAQATKLISTDSSGAPLPGDSCEPKISADGTKVTFTVSASSKFGTAARQVVRKDLTTGVLELISHSTSGAATGANADSSEPAISADGSVVAFTSHASDLDGLGTPVGGAEAFVSLAQSGADGAARALKRVRNGDGTLPSGSTSHPQLSDDGTILVMQTSGVFFAPASQTSTCGTVAITTNFFTPAALGSSLCTGQTSNQNPAISGDGSTTGLDSDAPQTGTSSSNSNPYAQGLSSLNGLGGSNFGGDFSGQWFDPNQSGQGLVIDVIHPDADNNRLVLMTWFVYLDGQPTWVQGAGVARAGSGAQAGMVIVQMDQVGIYQGHSFPLGQAHATATLWGSITLAFADASTGTMNWTSSYPGFNSGSMAITHFLPVGLPANDAPGAQVKACYSGNWFNPAQSGHGFELEVFPSTPPLLVVDWFAYGPTGTPVWLSGAGAISGNTAQVPLALIDGTGAQFPPRFDPAGTTQHLWGTATFTFTDSAHGHVAWSSTITGYGSGELDLQPTFGAGLLDRRSCQ